MLFNELSIRIVSSKVSLI